MGLNLFGSTSKQETDQSTTVKTTTSTNVGDVGLQSIDARDILISSLTETGNAFSRFAGATADVVTANSDVVNTALAANSERETTQQLLARNAPLIAAAGALGLAIYAMLKR